LVFDKQKILR